MNLFRTGIAVGTLNLLISTLAYAGVGKNSASDEGVVHLYRMTARHIEPEGIGYNEGYTTLEGFFPLYNGSDNWIPFLDVRGHVFNNGKPAVNAGLGVRYLSGNRVWGVNTYYDYRKTNHQHYNQVALGLESLGRVWDFRINGYLPVGKKQSSNYDLRFDRFEGHTALLREKYEYAFAGANAEVGAHLDHWKHFPLYFAAGPYYLTGKGSSIWGGQLRGSIHIFDYLKIDGNVSYDPLFKWIGQGQVGLSFSFGGKKKPKQKKGCTPSKTIRERGYQPVDRFEIIPVDKKHTKSAAIDPATGLPYQFIFVDNTSSSLGTYESPYHDLATVETNSAPRDIIYIFPGDGTTTGLDQGITLQDYQKLWGSGVAQRLSTSLGSVTIPAQSSGTYNGVVITPMITNSSGSVVTVGNGNEIAGLFLSNQGSNDVITSTNKTSLTVLNSTLAGINASGAIGINASELSGTLTVLGCNINQATNGILLQNSSGTMTANISNTTFSSSGNSDVAFQWALSNAAEGHLNVSNCTAVVRNNALEVDLSDTSTLTAVINNNTLTTGSYGVYINSQSGATAINANISNNTMTTYYQSVWIVQTGSAIVNLKNNDLFATSEPTFEIDVNTGSTITNLTIAGNSFITDDSDNIYLYHVAGDLSGVIQNNNFKGMDYNNCIRSNVNSNANLSSANLHTLTIVNNSLASGQNGIEIDQNTGSVNVTANNNTFSGLYDSDAVFWHMEGTPTSSSLTMNGNTINAYEGVGITQDTSCPLDVVLNNNIINATNSGIDFHIYSDSTNTLSMTGNMIRGFSPFQIEHEVGSMNATINNNTFIAAGNHAFSYNAYSLPITEGTVNASGNMIVTAGFSGSSGSAVYLLLQTTGSITTNFTNNTFNGDVYAVKLDLNGATHTMDLSNNNVQTGGGYNLTANSGSGHWLVNGNQFTALNSAPVTATAAGGDVCLQLNNNTAYPTPNAYNLTKTSGTFTVNTPVGNIGEITQSQTTEGSCP